jgi:hypothetical protein
MTTKEGVHVAEALLRPTRLYRAVDVLGRVLIKLSVRSSSKSGHFMRRPACPLWANSGSDICSGTLSVWQNVILCDVSRLALLSRILRFPVLVHSSHLAAERVR